MRKGSWLMVMLIWWTTVSLSHGQAEGTKETLNGLEKELEAVEVSSPYSGSSNGALAEVDYLGRMETVLLRYKALQQRLESVPERNKERFETVFAELLEKSTPLDLRVDGLNLDVENEVEIIDLRETAIGRSEVVGERVALDSSWPTRHNRCFPENLRNPGNPILELKPLSDCLFEISDTLEDIAEEILTFATELVGGD